MISSQCIIDKSQPTHVRVMQCEYLNLNATCQISSFGSYNLVYWLTCTKLSFLSLQYEVRLKGNKKSYVLMNGTGIRIGKIHQDGVSN